MGSTLQSEHSLRQLHVNVLFETDKRRYGITLLLATGSPQHIEELHALAIHKGLKLGPEGLLRGRKVRANPGDMLGTGGRLRAESPADRRHYC